MPQKIADSQKETKLSPSSTGCSNPQEEVTEEAMAGSIITAIQIVSQGTPSKTASTMGIAQLGLPPDHFNVPVYLY